MSRENDPMPPDPDALPPRLEADLASLYPTPRVPPALDREILDGAAAAFARQLRFRRRLHWAWAGAAAAAAVFAVVLAVPRGEDVPDNRTVSTRPPSATAPARPLLAGDVDGNGRVDVLDAFALSRKVRDARGPLPFVAQEDANHDGRVDWADVDYIAKLAVHASDSPIAGAGRAHLADGSLVHHGEHRAHGGGKKIEPRVEDRGAWSG